MIKKDLQGRHPAGLNLGDCFTYALADRTGHPVLCTAATSPRRTSLWCALGQS
jgi:ribonuclease VapC